MAPTDEISDLYSKMREKAFQVANTIEVRLELKSTEGYGLIHRALVIELYACQLLLMEILTKVYLAPERLRRFREAVESGGINELVDALHSDAADIPREKQTVMVGLDREVSRAIQKYESAIPMDPRERGGDIFDPEPISGIGRFCKGVAEAIGSANDPEYRAMAVSTMAIGVAEEDIKRAAESL